MWRYRMLAWPPRTLRLAPSHGRCSLRFRGGCDRESHRPNYRDFRARAASCRPQHPCDRAREFLPLRRLDGELLTSLWGQTVILRAPIVVRRAVFEIDPTPFNQPMKRRVEGPLLHLQGVVRAARDC